MDEDPGRPRRRGGWLKFALAAFGTALGAALLLRALRGRSAAELLAAIEALPAARVAASAGFVAGGALCHSLFDHLALIYAGARQPWRRAAIGSFCASGIGHAFSLAGATTSVIRWRFWSRWGVSGDATVRALLFCGSTVVLGHLALAGVACLAAPEVASRAAGLSETATRILGSLCLALCALYVAAAAVLRRPLVVKGRAFGLPEAPVAAAQVAAGAANYACVAAALHQLIAGVSDARFAEVAAAYSASTVASAITRAPSGLGVLETVVPALLPGVDLIGPLLAFRALDLIAPLPLAILAFALSEARHSRIMKAPEA